MAKRLPVFLGWILIFGASQADAQKFVEFPSGAQGLYHVPASGSVSHIAFLTVHRTGDNLNHVSTEELPKRGFSVLGLSTRFRNNEAAVNWELMALDVRAGVRFLRSQPGITRVILIGHSGGGPTTSYYQAIAENGVSFCQDPHKLVQCSSEQLAGFVATDKADGIVFTDGHPSNGLNRLRELNPSLISEDSSPMKNTSAALDPFSEKNGYNPDGESVYSAEFVEEYSKAQARRMNNLIEKALQIRKDMLAGKHVPTNDDAFIFYRTSARLAPLSTDIHSSTLRPAKLLKNDGTIDDSGIVHTVRVLNPGNKASDASFRGVEFLTITSFLSTNAIRSTHSLDDARIDWCSTNNSVPCAVQQISVPILVAAAQGHYFVRDSEVIYEHTASRDKDFIVVEGMTHGLGPCTACAEFHGIGPFDNARTNLFNYMRDWANARF